MIKKITVIGLAFSTVVLPVASFSPIIVSPAAAQSNRCDVIQDRDRRLRCKWADSDAKRYEDEARGWREEEARIRRDHERACRQVGLVAKFTGSGRYLRAACVAPRIINDRLNR
jgi:hypothetical protein